MGQGAPRPILHIPPHGVVLLSVRPQHPDPHLVSTTFHISQGGEVSQWILEEDAVSLTIGLGRVARGSVWLALPSRPSGAWLNDDPLPEKSIRAVAVGVWAIAFQVNHVGILRVTWPGRPALVQAT